jgi:hypothetical protein
MAAPSQNTASTAGVAGVSVSSDSMQHRRSASVPSHILLRLIWPLIHQALVQNDESCSVSSQQFTCVPTNDGKEIYATHGRVVLCSTAHSDVTNLAPCCHEEADTWLLLHVSDAVQKGSKKVTIGSHERGTGCGCILEDQAGRNMDSRWY